MSDPDGSFDVESIDDLFDATVEIPAVLLLGAACGGCCGVAGTGGRRRSPCCW